MMTDWSVDAASEPGWVELACPDEAIAIWLQRAILAENVRIAYELRNVVTAVTRTHHSAINA